MLDVLRSFGTKVLGGLDAKKRESIVSCAAGIIEGRSAVPAQIGRNMPSNTSIKHCIKRVERLLGNVGFDVSELSQGLLKCFDFVPRQRAVLTLDWTKIGRFWLMTTSLVLGSRSLPFHWTVVDTKKWRLLVVQQWHMHELRDMLPPHVEFVLLFDAGYDDVNFLKCLLADGFKFVVRFSSTVCIRPAGCDEWRNMRTSRLVRKEIYDWKEVEFTKDHALTGVRVVGFHDEGMKDAWLLVTNLQDDAEYVIKLYARRFETEELFKDLKDVKNALQLKAARMEDGLKLRRLIAVATFAYYVMVLWGIYGESLKFHLKMQANTVRNRRVLALWRVGRDLLRRGKVRPHWSEVLEIFTRLLRKLSTELGGLPCHPYG